MSTITLALLLLALLLVLALAAGAAAVTLYNGLVRARVMVDEGWSGIEVQLQRRADLIPALVETVRAHAAHERGLFEEIAARRSAAAAAPTREARAEAEQGVTQSLSRLVAVAEAYPALTADAGFLGLQRALGEVEEALQDARRYFNATVRELNLRVESFPSALLAGPLGFRRAAFFDTGEDERLRRPPALALGG